MKPAILIFPHQLFPPDPVLSTEQEIFLLRKTQKYRINSMSLPNAYLMHTAEVSLRTVHCLMQSKFMSGGTKTSASKELLLRLETEWG